MKLYRLMKVAPDGKPVVGGDAMMLGVRAYDPARPNRRFDVPAVAGDDVVNPGEGGLSCFSDRAAIRVNAANLELWSIDTAALTGPLEPHPAGPPHYHVEPDRPMTLADLQAALAATRDAWVRE